MKQQYLLFTMQKPQPYSISNLQLEIIMIVRTFQRVAKICQQLSRGFSHQKIPPARYEVIKNHSLHTEYADLNPIEKKHTSNKWRILDDDTGLKFVVEEGGFPNCSDIGILFNVGTQQEVAETAGSLSALETMVHIKPNFEDSIKNYQFLHQTGASINFNYDVEQTYLGCAFFQEDQHHIIDLILDVALREKHLFEGDYQTPGEKADMAEQIRCAAFGGQGIGMPKTGLGNVLSNQDFLKFQRQFLTPHGTIISLSNFVDPSAAIGTIKQKIQQRYPQFLKRKQPQLPVSHYQGGVHRIFTEDLPFFEFGVAFPGCEYKSSKMELYNILRVLLGTASSFSSGGPGKGMHSRCTKNLLNKEGCIDSASYILTHYQHYGLFGLTTKGYTEDAEELVRVGLREMSLLREPIPEQELERAKNILLSGVYMNIEKQSDRLQELTRNIQCYGRIKLNEFEENIRKVTVGDVYQEMNSLFERPPTFVLKGDASTRKIWPDTKLTQALLSKPK